MTPDAADEFEDKAGGDEFSLIEDLREAFGYSEISEVSSDSSASAPGLYERLHRSRSSQFGPQKRIHALSSGTALGDFRIEAELGRGGMGVVYLARQNSLGREVALKVLPAGGRDANRAIDRFRAEAQAAARLHHTNIVSIYAQGEFEGHFFYAMELVDGVGLDTVIKSRPDLLSSIHTKRAASGVAGAASASAASALSWPSVVSARRASLAGGGNAARAAPPLQAEARLVTGRDRPPYNREDFRNLASLFAEVAEAVQHAHEQGVLHRDIKPHNLLLGRDMRLHLTDFGLARLVDEPNLTLSGEVMGTPSYLSPEQVRGKPGEIRETTDVFSLGITLYELVTGHKPFEGDNRDQIMHRICHDEPLPPRARNPRVPIELETICLRAIEKEPRRRYSTAGALAEDLRRFAEGRPILSRRATLLTKAVKWVRRHQAMSVAIAACLAVVFLGGVLATNVVLARRASAANLTQQAYDQLVYYDYRHPESVVPLLDEAVSKGANGPRLELSEVLVAIGEKRNADAVATLRDLRAADPKDRQIAYLLAWALWRNNQRDDARVVFDEAEALGTPERPDTWLFRGLALHYARPQEAIEAYRQASLVRARDNEFFPQAILHLARARNQLLYATRDIAYFGPAEANLTQLVENGHYGAYPHYLLSISHRLAAEVYKGSSGVRDDRALVADYYADSLAWAREGQEVDPTDDRPVAAEAQCLESMGRLEEAAAAWDRMIELTGPSSDQACEAYHYRWRLRYWLGDLDGAAADVERHASCIPDSRFYAHVYPALLLAERGEVEKAVEEAWSMVNDSSGANDLIWAASTLRLLGRSSEADALMADGSLNLDFTQGLESAQTPGWLEQLYAFCRGDGSLEELEALANTTERPWMLWGEARFHAAIIKLARGDREGAYRDLGRAYRSFDRELRYTFHAELLRKKMEIDPHWPEWVVVSWDAELPGEGPSPGERMP